MFFLLRSEIRFRSYCFKLCLPPPFFGLVSDVHELYAKRAAVGLTQILQDFTQWHALFAEIGVAGVKHHIHISIGKAVKRGLKIGK